MGQSGAGVINIPGYSVSGEIGRGGMAVVYRARQVLLDREVALKVLNPSLAQDPVYAQRFLQEARMLASLGHPHIVPVYDVGVTPEGLHYFSMQLFTAGDFGKRLREGIDEVELLRVLLAVAQALGFAHARGYVHRDVTPANILFDERNRPVLTDFGIARALASTSRITATGLSVGTSHYMSPEQARGHEVDRRSDIYSLGVLVYEALAGKPPFDGQDGFAVAYAHVHEPVPRLPEELERWQPLIDRAMAKSPDERFEDCAAFIQGLREAAPKEFALLLKREGPAVVPQAVASPARAGPRPSGVAAASIAELRAAGPGAPSRLPLYLAAATLALGVLVLAGYFVFGGDRAAPVMRAVQTPPPSTSAARTPPATRPAVTSTPSAAPSAPDEGVDAAPVERLDGAIETAQAIALGEVPTVEDPVEALLALGRAALAAQRYTLPAGNSAADYFRLVQRFEPRNTRAREGLAAVARGYVELAGRHDPENALDAWLEQVVRSETLARDYQASEVLAETAALRAGIAQRWIAAGEQALLVWDRETAAAEFSRALKVQPDAEAARRGLAEARVVGLPGYAFRDAVQGLATPELVVIGTYALGRREVSVAEFRSYWRAEGQAKFGARLPTCRDRENALRFGKRSWESPGFAQTDRHPVVCVTPAMAEGFAAWLSTRTGRSYRLPSAAEWRAASGAAFPVDCAGNVRDESFRSEFGGREGAACSDGFAATAPVASFAARNPGLYDVDGNVREWVSDCAPGNCRERLALGASWFAQADDPASPEYAADTAFNTVGFRVLREID